MLGKSSKVVNTMTELSRRTELQNKCRTTCHFIELKFPRQQGTMRYLILIKSEEISLGVNKIALRNAVPYLIIGMMGE